MAFNVPDDQYQLEFEESTMSGPQQKVVLITGASAGIGKYCAEHLVKCGYRVFGTSRRAAASMPTMQAALEMIQMDVDDDRSVNEGVQAVLRNAGRLDSVINNAGWGLMGAIEDTSVEEAKAQLETNFFGVLRVCRAVLPIMRQQGNGYIVNISSLAGIVGLPFSGLYSASKFALEGMSESLRLETRRFGIRVVLVEPGDFRTNFPMARRLTQASSANSAYRDALEKARVAQERDELHGPSPEPIAYLIDRILRKQNPRARYSIGLWSQRIVVPCKRYLPQRLFEWLLCRVLGL
jgi:NAD(P)-dependent dehydrogenase (short-subunit alcohol dehydrogenase family)